MDKALAIQEVGYQRRWPCTLSWPGALGRGGVPRIPLSLSILISVRVCTRPLDQLLSDAETKDSISSASAILVLCRVT